MTTIPQANRTILYMARFQEGKAPQLCKVKPKRILPIMLERGFVEIEAQEWKRLLAEKRGLPLPEESEE